MLRIVAIGIAAALAAATVPAGAQDDGSCSYGGRRYASGVAVCQAGVVQTCVGGEWQGDGTFCSGAANGANMGVPVLGPGQVDTARRPGLRGPTQNAPIDDD